eukprot:CAMPEP_0117543318 /NCGR_PEP_ID=MMETSP0784-20121206/44999_1 /TAXON_ID=39447 /ORGANISM="" /LENGTH=95 /DNA_ID=CAMNT_0005340093 /DNA_START=499 /DNA_END=782 /DNA_ORIENTATION=+
MPLGLNHRGILAGLCAFLLSVLWPFFVLPLHASLYGLRLLCVGMRRGLPPVVTGAASLCAWVCRRPTGASALALPTPHISVLARRIPRRAPRLPR